MLRNEFCTCKGETIAYGKIKRVHPALRLEHNGESDPRLRLAVELSEVLNCIQEIQSQQKSRESARSVTGCCQAVRISKALRGRTRRTRLRCMTARGFCTSVSSAGCCKSTSRASTLSLATQLARKAPGLPRSYGVSNRTARRAIGNGILQQ